MDFSIRGKNQEDLPRFEGMGAGRSAKTGIGRKVEVIKGSDKTSTTKASTTKASTTFWKSSTLPGASKEPLAAKSGRANQLLASSHRKNPQGSAQKNSKVAAKTNMVFEGAPLFDSSRSSFGVNYKESDSEETVELDDVNTSDKEHAPVDLDDVDTAEIQPSYEAPTPQKADNGPQKKSASLSSSREADAKLSPAVEKAQTWAAVRTQRRPSVRSLFPATSLSDSTKIDSPHSKTIQAIKEFNEHKGATPKLLKVVTLPTGEQYLQFTEVPKEGKFKGTIKGLLGFSAEFKADQVISLFSKTWSESINAPRTTIEEANTLTVFCENLKRMSSPEPDSVIDYRVNNQKSELSAQMKSLVDEKTIDPSSLTKKALSEAGQLNEELKSAMQAESAEGLSNVLERALRPGASGLATILREINDAGGNVSDAQFQKLHVKLEDAFKSTSSIPQEIEDLRDTYVAVLVHIMGPTIAGKFVAYEYNEDIKQMVLGVNSATNRVEPKKNLNIDNRFREGSIASTLYRGFARAVFDQLQNNSQLLNECIGTAANGKDVASTANEILQDITRTFKERLPGELVRLNKELSTVFVDMFQRAKDSGIREIADLRGEKSTKNTTYSQMDPEKEAEKQLISMTFLRLVTPPISKNAATIQDKATRAIAMGAVKSLQSAATYSEGIRKDKVAAELVPQFESLAKILVTEK